MLTLEEVAEEQEKLWRTCPASENELSLCNGFKDCISLANSEDKGCLKCATEHWQLAEWLRDYKRLKEQELCEDAISRESIKRKLKEHHDFFVDSYGGFSNLPRDDKSRVDEITNCIAIVLNEPSIHKSEK